MRRLRECKDFGEIFEVIGKDRFGKVAYGLGLMLFLAPLVAGGVNFHMLYMDYYHYDAYEYNYRCMTVWNIVYTLMIFWIGLYFMGQLRLNGRGIKGLLLKVKEKQAWLLWWLALLVWSIIPVICSTDTWGALLGISQLSSGYVSHIYMFGVLGCIYIVSGTRQRENVIWAFIGITDILAAIMIAYEYDIPFLRMFTAAPGVSVLTNSNHFGYIIAMAAIAVSGMFYMCIYDSGEIEMRRLKATFCVASYITEAFAIVINDTLGSYLAIVFALSLMPVLWRARTGKFKVASLIPLVILICITVLGYNGLIYTKLGSTIGQSLPVFIRDLFAVGQKSEGYRRAGTNRIGLWLDTIEKIKEHPIVGFGPDISVDRSTNTYILENTPHNEYLECAFFLGIPGLIMYLGGLFHLCISMMKKIKRLTYIQMISGMVVVAYLASAFFGVRKFNTVCYMFVFLALLVRNEASDINEEE